MKANPSCEDQILTMFSFFFFNRKIAMYFLHWLLLTWRGFKKSNFHKIGTTICSDIKYLMSIFTINDSILILYEGLEMESAEAQKKTHLLTTSDSSPLPTVALLTSSPLLITLLHVCVRLYKMIHLNRIIFSQ